MPPLANPTASTGAAVSTPVMCRGRMLHFFCGRGAGRGPADDNSDWFSVFLRRWHSRLAVAGYPVGELHGQGSRLWPAPHFYGSIQGPYCRGSIWTSMLTLFPDSLEPGLHVNSRKEHVETGKRSCFVRASQSSFTSSQKVTKLPLGWNDAHLFSLSLIEQMSCLHHRQNERKKKALMGTFDWILLPHTWKSVNVVKREGSSPFISSKTTHLRGGISEFPFSGLYEHFLFAHKYKPEGERQKCWKVKTLQ